MKIKGLLLFALFLFNTTLMAQEIVFDATVDHSGVSDPGPQSIKKSYWDNTIKIEVSNGDLNHNTHYAIYANSTLTISVDGDLKIVKLELVREDSETNTNKLTSLEITNSGGKILKDEVGRKIWIGCDKSGNSVSLKNKSTAVYLSKIIVTLNTFNISEAGFATMWLDNGYIMPEGVIGHSINIENGKLVYLKNYTKGYNIPEGFPLLIEGEAKTYKYEPIKYEFTGSSKNKLKESTGSTITVAKDGDKLLYKFSYDSDGKNLGFYRDSENGKSVTVPYGKCYLMISETELASSGTANAKGFSLSDVINGIDNITDAASETDKRIYDLRGVFLGYDLDDLPKGIYIQNGKKIVIK